MSKTLVIGLDGMSPELLNLLIEQDIFSNIGSMVREGVCGDLESTFPPSTVPAWPSFATGVNPGKHGIFDWVPPEGSFLNLKPVTSQDMAVKTFYELLCEQGRKCVLVNLPVSWPALTGDPTLTSFMTQSENWVYPAQLKEEFPVLKKYRIVPDKSPRYENEVLVEVREFVDDVRSLEKTRAECALELMKLDWDFFFVLFISGEAEKEVLDFFGEVDSYAGKLVEAAGDNLNVFIMSDHGFKVASRLFYINMWLEREGYLATSSEHTMPRHFSPLTKKQKTTDKRSSLPSRWIVRIPLLSGLYQKLRKRRRSKRKVRLGIDTQRTKAYSTTNGLLGIYINRSDLFEDGIVAPADYEALRDEIIEKLQTQTDPETGESIFANVWRREELREGPHVSRSPDILLDLHPDYSLPIALRWKNVVRVANHPFHDKTGILIAWGQDIKQKGTIENAHITDLAPTILHTLHSPIPDNLDGKVLLDIFDENSSLRKSGVILVKAEETDRMSREEADEKAIERLRTLGYLD